MDEPVTLGFFGHLSTFEIILGIVEIAVFIVLFRTLRVMYMQHKQSNNEMAIRNRPYLGIDSAEPGESMAKHVVSNLYIRNFGTMPAYNTRFAKIKLENTRGEKTVEKPSSALIPPGRRNPTPLGITPEMLREVMSGKDYLKARVKVEYSFGEKQYWYEADLELTARLTWEINREEGN